MLSQNQSKSNAIKAAQDRIRSNKSTLGDIEKLANEVVGGKVEAIARAITLIESNNIDDRPQAHLLLKQVREKAKNVSRR